MEDLILISLLIVSGIYLVKHFKRMLTVGEEESRCTHCPAANLSILSDKKNPIKTK